MGFESSVRRLLKHEGVDCAHLHNTGRLSKYGLSKQSHPRIEIESLQVEDAKAFYKREVWDEINGDSLPGGVAYMVFDTAVTQGLLNAARFLQHAVRVAPNGKVSNDTLSSVRNYSPQTIIDEVKKQRLRAYQTDRNWRFYGEGWTKRLESVFTEAMEFIELSIQSPIETPVSWLAIGNVGWLRGFVIDDYGKVKLFSDQGAGSPMGAKLLASALYGCHDEASLTSGVSFSLDPWEPTNPFGPSLRKVHYPPSLQGTVLGDVMFEADFLLKKLSMGKEPIPPALRTAGLHSVIDMSESDRNQQCCRSWFVIKDVQYTRSASSFDIESMTLGVEARTMVQTASGVLEDAYTDPASPFVRFAKQFTKLFQQISEHFPIFRQLEEGTRAVLVARQICDAHVPLDRNELFEVAKSPYPYNERVCLQKNTSDSLRFSDIGITTSRITMLGGVSLNAETPKNTEFKTALETVIFNGEVLGTSFDLPTAVKNCQVCNDYITIDLGKDLCRYHSPDACAYCFKGFQPGVPYRECPQFGYSGKAHSDCCRCDGCGGVFQESMVKTPQGKLVHEQCASHTETPKDPVEFQPPFNCSNCDNYNRSVDRVLQHEGGLVNNPRDRGGLTNFGISQRAYPNVDIRSLTKEDAKGSISAITGILSEETISRLGLTMQFLTPLFIWDEVKLSRSSNGLLASLSMGNWGLKPWLRSKNAVQRM